MMSPWTLGFFLGGIVVAVVAALLVTILAVAWRIESLASTVLRVAGQIETGTQPIWALGTANSMVEDIVRTVRSIDRRVTTMAQSLEGGGT